MLGTLSFGDLADILIPTLIDCFITWSWFVFIQLYELHYCPTPSQILFFFLHSCTSYYSLRFCPIFFLAMFVIDEDNIFFHLLTAKHKLYAENMWRRYSSILCESRIHSEKIFVKCWSCRLKRMFNEMTKSVLIQSRYQVKHKAHEFMNILFLSRIYLYMHNNYFYIWDNVINGTFRLYLFIHLQHHYTKYSTPNIRPSGWQVDLNECCYWCCCYFALCDCY